MLYTHYILHTHNRQQRMNHFIIPNKQKILNTCKVVGIAPIDRDHQAPLDAEACQDLLEMELLLGFRMIFFLDP